MLQKCRGWDVLLSDCCWWETVDHLEEHHHVALGVRHSGVDLFIENLSYFKKKNVS